LNQPIAGGILDKRRKMIINRLFSIANRHFVRRALPHGIINWRYLLPSPHPKVRIHRRFWLMNKPSRLPLALFLIVDFFLWLRWVLFAGWRTTWRAVQLRGKTIQEQENISISAQLFRVLSISLGCCIPPAEIYAFGLYRPQARQNIWNYVFTHELPGFHLWRNTQLQGNQQSLSVLQDKYETSKLLAAKGIPMAPILSVVSRGAAFDPMVFLQSHPRLFCKPRHGSGSRDAFVVEINSNQGQVSIFTAINGIQAPSAASEQLQKAMMLDDFLIQPFLNNHEAFAVLTSAVDVVTIRVITENNPGTGIICYCATIEIPNDSRADGYNHIILPINPESGRLNVFPDQHLPEQFQARYEAIYQRMDDFVVPYWETIIASALAAHQCIPGVYAIAWDYVAAPEGPYLLEGNTGWGTRVPQIIHGGLLKNIGKTLQS
jgi:hypothetical protein